jgi:site-specific DNA-methyltransferase (adenine-specific)
MVGPTQSCLLGLWKKIGLRPVSHLSLVKDRFGLGQFTRTQHETAYLLAKGHPQQPEEAISDVLYGEQNSPVLHPNQKPFDAFSKLIATYSPASGSVLDPFCGSGTTLVAARALGRRAIGIEIEERYCQVTAVRLAQQIFQFRECSARPEQLTFM